MAVQIVDMLNLPSVNQSTIRTWAERGKVAKYGRDQYGLQKYELRDIVRMASAKAASAA
jgi:phage terminase Nu1 subunit (DNA packaging protein)